MVYTSGQDSYRTLRRDDEQSGQESFLLGRTYDVLRLTLKEFLCDRDVSDFGRELSHYLEHHEANLALDFRKVDFFGVGALGKLIFADKRLKQRGRKSLRIKGMKPETAEVIYITGLNRIFDIDEETKTRYQEHQGDF